MIQKKICMVGAPSVGKTSLVARYVHSIFSDKYLSTVGVKIDQKRLQVDGRDVTLMVWDLAGDDDFQPLKVSYLRAAAGYLLVADGSRRATLEHAVQLHARVTQAVGTVPFVLVLNKSDLVGQWDIEDARLAALMAQGWTVERTSARDGTGVEAVFEKLARRTLAHGRGKAGRDRSA
ncbi:MAG: GTP-binding protein [Verrucomicrobiae bacterium]|nr:GTP-binding protein [Verrucomicrobiae bacterium]